VVQFVHQQFLPLLRRLAFGDVLHHTHDVKKPAICATDRRGAHRKPDHAPTLANEAFLHRIKFELAGDLLAESFAIGIGVIRVRVGE